MTLAAAHNVKVGIDRDSPDPDVLDSLRRVQRKVRSGSAPDEDVAGLAHALNEWEQSRSVLKPKGRRRAPSQKTAAVRRRIRGKSTPEPPPAVPPAGSKTFRIQSQGVLLTYHGFQDAEQFERYSTLLGSNLRDWGVKYWCCTLERCESGSLHVHTYLQFSRAVVNTTTATFAFEGIVVGRADPHDLLGEGLCKKKMQQSMDRGFFYVWADKKSTVLDANGQAYTRGNYFPAWTGAACSYAVAGRWLDALHRAYKLSHDTYRQYVYKAGDGVCFRIRNLDAIEEREKKEAMDKDIAARVKRIRGNRALYREPPLIPEAVQWVQVFQEDRLRYPILILLGPSMSGKTEYAHSLFKNALELKIGTLDTFPDTLRAFDRNVHDAIILDDIRDMAFLGNHQEKLQGPPP